jgi:hypothetical protein
VRLLTVLKAIVGRLSVDLTDLEWTQITFERLPIE